MGCATGGISGNWTVQFILLIGHKASGTSINVKEGVDAGSGCIGRTNINVGNNFSGKQAIRRKKEERRFKSNGTHGG